MKKLLGILVLFAMLCGVIALPAAAEEEPAGLDANLVVFYDFKGETLEEQLSDKAPAGNSKDNLTFYITEDEESGEALSYISDGVAHIASAGDNYLLCEFDNETGTGGDIYGLQEEMTMVVTFAVNGSWTAFVDFFDLNNIVRCFIKATNSDGISANLEIRPAQNAYSSGTNAVQIQNGQVFAGMDTVTFAVTTAYDPEAKTLTVCPYVSFKATPRKARGLKFRQKHGIINPWINK